MVFKGLSLENKFIINSIEGSVISSYYVNGSSAKIKKWHECISLRFFKLELVFFQFIFIVGYIEIY